MDGATSSDPAVRYQLARLWALSPGVDVLGLGRITTLLQRLGDPHLRLPPVLHVAGTNGKGSTCAFLRAALEAAGLRCHVYTSPHLVRFNERIRVAGQLIDDAALAALLGRVLDQAVGIGASFFEVTTAAAFLAFSEAPADACVIEVGLGGRLDATNVIPSPLITGIAQLGIDHQAFLGNTLEAIAGEKAGIAKSGTPLVTMRYPPKVAAMVADAAHAVGAPLLSEGAAWHHAVTSDALRYRDEHGALTLPLPTLAGPHQAGNLALAVAMLRHQHALPVPVSTFAVAAREARWPARMQRLGDGPLTRRLPDGSALWLDGGHNPAASHSIARTIAEQAGGRPVRLVLGMLANKDAAGFLAPFRGIAEQLVAVPVPGHEHHAPADLADTAARLDLNAATAENLEQALDAASAPPAPVMLICGSLYLAGVALAANGELPA